VLPLLLGDPASPGAETLAWIAEVVSGCVGGRESESIVATIEETLPRARVLERRQASTHNSKTEPDDDS
jgi:hypothetical protein